MHRKICAELLAAAIFLASQSIISQMVPASAKVVAKPQLATRMIDLDVDPPAAPALSPDGRRLFFGRWDTKRSELLSQPVDGSG